MSQYLFVSELPPFDKKEIRDVETQAARARVQGEGRAPAVVYWLRKDETQPDQQVKRVA